MGKAMCAKQVKKQKNRNKGRRRGQHREILDTALKSKKSVKASGNSNNSAKTAQKTTLETSKSDVKQHSPVIIEKIPKDKLGVIEEVFSGDQDGEVSSEETALSEGIVLPEETEQLSGEREDSNEEGTRETGVFAKNTESKPKWQENAAIAASSAETASVIASSQKEAADGTSVKDTSASVAVKDSAPVPAKDSAIVVAKDSAAASSVKDPVATSSGKDTSGAGSLAKTGMPKDSSKVEIEIDRPTQRHHLKWLWWILAAVLVGLLVVGGWFLVRNLNTASTETEPDSSEVDKNESDSPEESGEENKEEEPKSEPEEPPVEEEPPKSEENPKPEEPTTPPIAERPAHNTDAPSVVPGSKLIALTFDDGPSAATTPRLLDILQGRGVKATFFVLGTMAQGAPDILRREVAEGHEVASHTHYHNQLTQLNFGQVRAEALEMDRIFTEILGTVPPFTRPPYGDWNSTVGEALGQPMILWSIDPRDWADRNASLVCNRVVSVAFDGAIILVHDIHASTVDAVPCIIDNLRAQGYQFMTVSDLAATRGVPLVNGAAYYSF